MLAAPFFVIGQALSRAASFVLGWATSLFFGQIPGGKERVVSMISAIALAWFLLTYVGGPVAIAVAILDRIGVIRLADARIDAAQIQAAALGILVLPPLIALLAEISSLTEGFSVQRWASRIPTSYPVAISLGASILLMLLIGPAILLLRRRRGLRTHHVPVLVMDGQFDELLADIASQLETTTKEKAEVHALGGAWALPMHAVRYAGARLFGSTVTTAPMVVRAADVEVAAFATDVNVTAPEDEAYRLRAELYKRLGIGRTHLTWSAKPQALEKRLAQLRIDDRSIASRLRDLDELESEIDRAPIGSDEWNVLYRIVLQMRVELTRDSRASTPQRSPSSSRGGRRARSRGRRLRS
jgi:hypothetical protein